jgi:beta-lactamase regulating signal transducer with metallopeptidase domain
MTATQWLEMLFSSSLQIAVLVGVCLLLDRVVSNPADKSRLWNVCFLCMLFLVIAGLMLPKLRIFQPWQYAEPLTLISAANVELLAAKVLFAVWCAGAVVMLARWLLHILVLQLELCRCELASPKALRELLGARSEHELGNNWPTLLISDEAPGPYCAQMHTPVIVIPRALLNSERAQLQHVLIHELAHLRNSHPLQHFIQQIVQVICWFHPAIWKASSHASLAREYCCDDEVIRSGVSFPVYLKTLLRISEYAGDRRKRVSITFGKTPSELKLRAKRLVESAKHVQSTSNRCFRKGLLAVGALLLISSMLTLLSVPTDPLASSRTRWSRWPKWSAHALHCLGVPARDYEVFDRRIRAFEQLHETGEYAHARG